MIALWQRPSIRWGVTLLVMLGILALAAAVLDVDRLQTVLAEARWGYLVPSTLLNLVTLAIIIWRWWLILGREARLVDCFTANQISAYLNLILPLRLGDISRAVVLRRHAPHLSMVGILSTVGAELTFDMLILMTLLAGLLLFLPLPPLLTTAGGVLAIGTTVAVLGVLALARSDALLTRIIRPLAARLLPERLAQGVVGIAARARDGLATLRDNRQVVALLLISLLNYAIQAVSNWLLLLVFLEDASLAAGLVALVGAGLGLALPLLPGSTGTYQLAVALALGSLGIAPEEAAAFAVVLHAQQNGITLVTGNLSMLREGVSVAEIRRATS